ncbi:hypothetical protein HanIR_Chr09g0419871 [Helianthus annuus]|nr:hypothetical protein HanIR_Chr09g0419871 [Helianthus annuus]
MSSPATITSIEEFVMVNPTEGNNLGLRVDGSGVTKDGKSGVCGFLFEKYEKVGFWVDLEVHLEEGVREQERIPSLAYGPGSKEGGRR